MRSLKSGARRIQSIRSVLGNGFPIFRKLLNALAIVIVVSAAWNLNQQYDLFNTITTGPFAVAVILALVYRVINPAGWVLVLGALGSRVDLVSGCRVWLLSESRRWLPGGIWGYTSRAVAANRQLDVSLPVASASLIVELLVTLVAAGIVAALGLLVYHQQLSSIVTEWINPELLGACLPLMLLLVALIWVARERLDHVITRLLRNHSHRDLPRFDFNGLSLSVLFMVAMALLNGFVTYVLATFFVAETTIPFMAIAMATSVAWVAGLVVVFAPGGLVVREAVFATMLLPWLPYEAGFSLALLARFAQLVAELGGMLFALAPAKTRVICVPE